MSKSHFIEKFWYRSLKNYPIYYFILRLLNLPFLGIVLLKRWSYQKRLKKTNTFSKPVIVVGNITIGGTGKTPFIAQLAKRLTEENINCGIVSRGYQAKIQQVPHQLTYQDTAEGVGDESFMLFNQLNVPVVIDPVRSRAVNHLVAHNEIDVVISDDGLQHYQMDRDIEILMVDSTREFGNQLILPFGPLREPISRCSTVDFILLNSSSVSNGSNRLSGFGPNNHLTSDIFKVTITPTKLINVKSNQVEPLEFLKNKTITAIAGIGNPDRFYSTLENLGEISSKITFPDHHHFRSSDLAVYSEYDQNKTADKIIVMTEKDAVKCTDFASDNCYYLKVEMQFEDCLIEQLLLSIKTVIKRKSNG